MRTDCPKCVALSSTPIGSYACYKPLLDLDKMLR